MCSSELQFYGIVLSNNEATINPLCGATVTVTISSTNPRLLLITKNPIQEARSYYSRYGTNHSGTSVTSLGLILNYNSDWMWKCLLMVFLVMLTLPQILNQMYHVRPSPHLKQKIFSLKSSCFSSRLLEKVPLLLIIWKYFPATG